jgi:excisionase family DNA binding protein
MREPDLTVKQVAEELQLSTKMVQILCASGRIKSYRVSSGPRSPIRVRARDLDAYKDLQPAPSR